MRRSSLLVLFALAGCPDRTIDSVTPEQGKVETKDIPTQRRGADILFVIDNSGSMKEEQDSLRANFGKMMQVLETLDGGMPDVHIGVTTSDMGTSAEDGTTDGSKFGCNGTGDDGQLRTAPVVTGRSPMSARWAAASSSTSAAWSARCRIRSTPGSCATTRISRWS
jgi:hypothetical protein